MQAIQKLSDSHWQVIDRWMATLEEPRGDEQDDADRLLALILEGEPNGEQHRRVPASL